MSGQRNCFYVVFANISFLSAGSETKAPFGLVRDCTAENLRSSLLFNL